MSIKNKKVVGKVSPDGFRCKHRHSGRTHPRCYRKYLAGKQENTLKLPKILIFDIETSPLKAYIWASNMWGINVNEGQVLSEWYMLSWAGKWLFSPEVISDRLTGKEAKNEDDKRIVTSLWDALNEADIVVAHNACVDKNSLILMQNLTWKKAGDLVSGDKVVGFEEKTKPGQTRRDSAGSWRGRGERKIVPAEVTNSSIDSRHCFEVEFDNGDRMITTDDHYWLGMSENCRNQQWYRTDKLRVGQKVNKFTSPWKEDTSYEAGWLSGFIAGEGTIKGNGASIDFCQRPTTTLEQAIDYCKKLGINLASLATKIGGLGRGDALYTYTLGGKWRTIETLGKLRITRLIENLNWNRFGGLNSTAQNDTTRTIVGIKDAGVKEVAVIETTSSTYIADGYPMHNCKFDVPNMNTRFIVNNLPPTKPYQTIDTLKIARKQFGFTHNNLNALARVFGFKVKLDTNFELWKRCIDGDEEALKRMETYNRHDVTLLEEVYLKIRPWIHSHPNLGLYVDSVEPVCSNCLSTNLDKTDKFYYTPTGKYELYNCECGAYVRIRTTSVPANKRKNLVVSVAR